jgi:hypothetical protein
MAPTRRVEMTGEEVLKLPMDANDSGATTIKGYLHALLKKLWQEEEGFSGKRPFGNSGWSSDLHKPLIIAGAVKGRLDPDGYIQECDSKEADRLIFEAIDALAA